MPRFTEYIETVRASEASVSSLFGGDGFTHRVGRRRPGDDPSWDADLAEAVAFIGRLQGSGQHGVTQLQEAMTTDDFPLLFGDALSRELLAGYQDTPTTWQNYAARRTVNDFREHKLNAIDGGEGRLAEVGEREEYEETSLSESEFGLTVAKFGRRMSFSWEMLINDQLNAFGPSSVTRRFGRAARRTEEFKAAELFVDADGPHDSLYTAGNGNIVTGNPALSRNALQTGLQIMAEQTDADGEPITIEAVELVVPPALQLTADEITSTTQIRITDADGNVQVISGNGVAANLRTSVNHYISTIATTNGDTTWFLFANPNRGRPAIALGFLRQHEQPEIFERLPNSRRVGGGEDLVDFETDAKDYKVRHVAGGARVEPKATVASNGTGVA